LRQQAKATASVTAMIEAFSDSRSPSTSSAFRMPHLRGQIDADNLEGFLTRLRDSAASAHTQERQRVLRTLVEDVLIDPEKITIRHRIPARGGSTSTSRPDPTPSLTRRVTMRRVIHCVGSVTSRWC
jgi:site-specific DNA recombinase